MIGFTTSELFLNGNPSVTLSNLNGADVTNMTVSEGDRKLGYTFPLEFNYGTIDSSFNQVLEGTDTITVKVSNDSSTSNAIFVDYLVPYSRLKNRNQWFLYDPDVIADEITATGASISANDAQGDQEETPAIGLIVGVTIGSVVVAILVLMLAWHWSFKVKSAPSSSTGKSVGNGHASSSI